MREEGNYRFGVTFDVEAKRFAVLTKKLVEIRNHAVSTPSWQPHAHKSARPVAIPLLPSPDLTSQDPDAS